MRIATRIGLAIENVLSYETNKALYSKLKMEKIAKLFPNNPWIIQLRDTLSRIPMPDLIRSQKYRTPITIQLQGQIFSSDISAIKELLYAYHQCSD